MDRQTAASLAKALSVFNSNSNISLDPSVLQLLRSDFFKQYQLFTEQVFFLLDHRTMKYLYVSENVRGVFGYPIEEIYEEGLAYIGRCCHPDDIESFNVIYREFANCITRIPIEKILRSRGSYDYRLRLGDGKYHRFLQTIIPLTVDENKSLIHALVGMTDISLYKKSTSIKYKMITNDENEKPTTILEGVIGNSPREKISAREREVVLLTSNGLTEKEIADKLSISIQTVKTHRKNLIHRMNVKNSAELVKYCMANLII